MSLLDTIKKMFGKADNKLKPIIEYYDNGKIKCAYSVDKNGNKQGPYESYHDNGQLMRKCTYKNGKLDGPYEAYYDNGQLWVKCTYREGLPLDKTGKIFKTPPYIIPPCIPFTSSAPSIQKSPVIPARVVPKIPMAPTQLRQSVKRAEVAKFRAKFPNKKDGR